MLWTGEDHHAQHRPSRPERASLYAELQRNGRSCLGTGTHSGHTAVRGNRQAEGFSEGQFPLPGDSETIFHDFRRAGYVTGVFGKWGLGPVGSSGDPGQQGVDRFFGYNCQALAHSYYPDHLWDNDCQIKLEGNTDDVPYGEGTYAPDLIHAEALRFLEEAVRDGKPFFLWYPTTIPHAELITPKDSIYQKYAGVFPEEPFHGQDLGDPLFRIRGYCSQPEPHAAFASMVTRLDAYVGQLISKLKELGVYDQTLIIFTSDNGPHLEGGADPDFFDSNGPFRGYKRDVYEGGIRVPMIVSWEGHIKQGSRTDFACSFWDLMPTFRNLLGQDVPEDADGVSLLPLLFGQERKQKTPDFQYFEFHEKGGRQALRQGDWKLVRMNVRGEVPTEELYNIATDPGEQQNLIEAYPDKAEQLRVLLEKAHTPNPNFPLYNSERGE